MKTLNNQTTTLSSEISEVGITPILRKLLLFTLLLMLAEVNAQTLFYDIKLGNRKIGEMKITSSHNGEDRQIKMESSFKTLMISGKCAASNEFEGDQLKSAVSNTYSNNDLKEGTHTSNVRDSIYKVRFGGSERKGAAEKKVARKIESTILSMYFEKPANQNEIYSERFGQNVPVKAVNNATYVVTTPDGRKSTYIYDSTYCREITSKLSGFRVSLVLAEVR